MRNTHMRVGDLVFSCSCSGDNIFSHNLNVPKGPGSMFQLGVEELVGSAYVKTVTANTITIAAETDAATIHVYPLQVIGDYPSL